MSDYEIKLNHCREFNVLKKYSKELENVSRMEIEKQENYTNQILKELLEFVYDNNEYYRNKLIDAKFSRECAFSKRVFENLGFISKSELRKNKDLILSVPKKKISQVHTSTGTSGGENIYIMYTLFDLFGGELIPRFGEIFNPNEDDVFAIGLPYEMSSSAHSFHRALQITNKASVIPIGKGGAYSEPKKAIKLMKELGCTVLMTSPSYAVELYKAAEELDLDVKDEIPIRQIWLTGEGCSNAFRERIEKRWGAVARYYYGSLECGVIGIECEAKSGYHIAASHVYLEVINPNTGEVLKDGEVGELVVTTLLREGMPLIRYRTEDLAYFDSKECKCGSTLKKLFLVGRVSDQIIIDNKQYSPFYIEEFLMRINEITDNYKFNIYNNELEIIVELDKEVEYYNGIEEEISKKVECGCGVRNTVKVVDKIEYSGKKAKRVNYINDKKS